MTRAILRDLRFGIRSLLRSPGFAATAIGILALGIGANTAVFSLIDAVLLRPVPGVAHPEALVDLRGPALTYPAYRVLRDEAAGVARMAAWRNRTLSLETSGDPHLVRGAVVTAEYFDVLGAAPAAGRFFRPAEEDSDEAVAVLSDGLAKRLGDPGAAIGRVVRLNGIPFTVVGIARPGFRGTGFGVFPEVWVPIGAWPRLATGFLQTLDLRSRDWGWLTAFGRLEPGTSRARADAAFRTILRRDAAAHGEPYEDAAWSVVPTLRTAAGFGSEPSPGRLFGIAAAAVGAALLMACANLANLLLARAAARRREMAIRRALGAHRGLLVRQLLAESVILALAGGTAGLVVATWALDALARIPLPGGIGFDAFGPELGARTIGFSLALSAATGIAFGLVPALRASRESIASLLAASAATTPRSGARHTLVAIQIAVCFALLATAGLLGRSLQSALAVDLGFRRDGVALVPVNLGLQRYDAGRAAAFAAELPRRLEAQPGITAAGWTTTVPLSGDATEETIEIEGRPSEGKPPTVGTSRVGSGYFRALEIPMVAGREFRLDLDRPEGVPAAIVNEAMARRFWPGTSPVGRRVRTMNVAFTVIGVARDFRFASIADPPAPQLFLSATQTPDASVLGTMTLAVRSEAGPARTAGLIRAEIRRLDPSLPVSGIRSLEDVIGDRLIAQRAGSALVGLFGGLSLLLAALGIYAVVSWSWRRRTREIAIRLSLGARAGDVRALVLRRMAGPVVAGLAAGIALAAAAGRLIQGVLHDVSPADPFAFGAAIALLGGVALAAAYLPARRAARVDPVAALRNE